VAYTAYLLRTGSDSADPEPPPGSTTNGPDSPPPGVDTSRTAVLNRHTAVEFTVSQPA
jgi:hypothetical protein